MEDFRDWHEKHLPTIRIQKAVLENFKSVKYGELVFNCGKAFVPYDTKSDILGIYGQNGSGKTTFIEALYILKGLLLGKGIPDIYSECISKDVDYAKLEFTFDLQYPEPNEMIRKVVYSACLKRQLLSEEDKSRYPESVANRSEYKMVIFNELLSVAGEIEGKKVKLQPFFDTATTDVPFGPASKRKYFVSDDNKYLIKLEVNKQLAAERSQSFIFCKETANVFEECDIYSDYYQIIKELRCFAELFFYVIDTKSTGFIQLNFVLPFYTRLHKYMLDAFKPSFIYEEDFSYFCSRIEGTSDVLERLVPGLRVKVHSIADVINDDGNRGKRVELLAVKTNELGEILEFPLRFESDGVRKIFSELSLLISVYNDRSFTLAIDEFDAGIFEYLLGEILQAIEESGKGQFIFTSHNLRPLEVIDKKFLYFTTTNPNNRYIHLKNVGKTNNLRSTYFREILLGEQEEEIYKKTKKHKMIAALKKAGKKEHLLLNEEMEE